MIIMGIPFTLEALVCIFILEAVVIKTNAAMKVEKVSGCHNNNVILNCPLYQTAKSESDSVDLEWKFLQKRWKRIAAIDVGGNRSLFWKNTSFQDRITVNPNGSLVIESLKPEDEGKYQCKVGADGNTKRFLVELNVTCSGKVTEIKREVCVEEDVILDCDAKHRTNPRKLKQITWHVKNTSNSLSWSPIVDSDGMTVKTGDGFKLNANGSLLVESRLREENEMTYRCEASKKGDSPRELHLILLKNIKCSIIKQKKEEISPVKVCTGQHLELPCPLLRPENVSDVRSLKWRVRHTGSPKHFQQLFHVNPKKVSNKTIFVQNKLARNTTRLPGMENMELGTNGSLLIKSVRDVDEGDYECITKNHRHHEPHRYTIRVKPTLCNETNEASEENRTTTSTAFVPRPTTIKTTAGRVAMTTSSTTSSESHKNQSESGTQFAKSFSQMLSKSRKRGTLTTKTSTSTWTMMNPPLQTIKTSTRVTTFTTFSSGAEDGIDFKTDHFVCGDVLKDPIGSFQTPNFPSAYPANSRCQWNISAAQGHAVINITLEYFDLEHEDDCRRDYIAFYDELGNLVGPRRCGIIDCPVQFQIKGRAAIVVFQSDASLQKVGFKLRYKSVA